MIFTLFYGRPFRGTMFLFVLAALTLGGNPLPAVDTAPGNPQPPTTPAPPDKMSEAARRRLAVALNYCKASFHRITKNPTQDVLIQEQRKILNNLDLSSIDEQDVITLYAGVIDEINQIELVDRERQIIDEFHNRSFRQKLFLNTMAAGAQAATFNYVGAVQSGVGSWWDYRTAEWGKESESWKLDKGHLSSLSKKTTSFIETSWKLARARNIPDEWLIRDIDLEQLEKTLNERDLAARLRILKRMESRMQCYPPYYYYVAKTEQMLGQLSGAGETYRKLQSLQTGHFRRDDMLAAALTNLAAIQHSRQEFAALDTARAALRESTDVWEANLVCANILAEYGDFTDAEDAVFRNLDTDLETEASRNSLALLYTRSGDVAKLDSLLKDGTFVAALKGPVLLQCARALGDQPLPHLAAARLLESFHGRVHVTFGRDDLVLTASDEWRLDAAQLEVAYGGVNLGRPEVLHNNGATQLVYRGILEVGTPWRVTQATRPISVQVRFPEQPVLAFDLHPGTSDKARTSLQMASESGKPRTAAPQGYLLTDIRSEQFKLAMDGSPAKNFVDPRPPVLKAAIPREPDPESSRSPQVLPAGQGPQRPAVLGEVFPNAPDGGPVELMLPE